MAGNNIKGIVIEIGGNTTELTKSLKTVDTQTKDTAKELKEIERLLKFSSNDTILLAQKQKLLGEQISTVGDKLKLLKEAEQQVQAQFAKGDINEEQYRALQREVVSTKGYLEKLESQAIKTNVVLSKDQAIGNLKNIGIAAAGAATAVGVAFVGMANAAIQNADELQRQSDVTGLSAERLQELAYAGSNLGVELDTITGAQAKLTKSMAAAKDGTGTQAEAFKTLGINVLDGNKQLKDAKVIMEEAFTALNGVGNETERDALAMELFGKSAMEMNPLIKAGGDELARLSDEARKNGAVMSDEAVAGLDSFGDTIDNIKTSLLGSFGEAFAQMLPNVQEFLGALTELPEWIKENSTTLELLAVGIGTITTLAIAFNINQLLLNSTTGIWAVIAGNAALSTTMLGAAFNFLLGPVGLAIIAIGAVVAAGVLLYKNWDELSAGAGKLGDDITGFFTDLGKSTAKAFDGMMDSIGDWWKDVQKWFKGKIDAVKDFGANFVKAIWDGAKQKWIDFKQWVIDVVSWWKDQLGFEDTTTTATINENRNITTNRINGSHADGLGYVPFNGYIAELHKGESVLTAQQTQAYTGGNTDALLSKLIDKVDNFQQQLYNTNRQNQAVAGMH